MFKWLRRFWAPFVWRSSLEKIAEMEIPPSDVHPHVLQDALYEVRDRARLAIGLDR